MKTKPEPWQSLPAPPECGSHSSPESRQLAEEIEAAIEAVELQRKGCDEIKTKLTDVEVGERFDIDRLDTDTKALKKELFKALQAEIDLRDLLAVWLERDSRELQEAFARWDAELPAALEAARVALRGAGFGAYVDFELSDTHHNEYSFRQMQDHQIRLNGLLHSYPKAAELGLNMRTARQSMPDRLKDQGENRRLRAAARERLVASQRAMVPVV